MEYKIPDPKLMIFVIHNNEDRVNNLLVQLKKLKLGEIHESLINEKVQINRILLFSRMVLKVTVEYRYANYLKKPSKPFKSFYTAFLNDFLPLMSLKKFYNYRKNIIIEHQISRKHIYSIEAFLKTKNKFLLILESDSILVNSKSLKKNLIIATEIMKSSTPAFTLLSKGFSRYKLGINYLHLPEDNFVQHEIASTNMLSAYLLNRVGAKQLLSNTKNYSSSIPLLPIDWHVNRILCDIALKGIEFDVYSLQSGDITHGSFEGYYKSWR